MQMERVSDQDWETLLLNGEIDLHASPALRKELQACAASKVKKLLIDFSAVDYIDSSGLATFIEYVRSATAYGGKLAFFGLQPKVRTIFDLVRLNELFIIEETREAALAALAS